MEQPYPDPPFMNSRTAFEALVTLLAGDDTADLNHADVERLLDSDGRELLRCLYQDHLDLRGVRDTAAARPMRGSDGEERTESRPGKRALGTLFGPVVVHRLALVKRGVSGGVRPLDAYLNLPPDKHSFGVQREICWGVAQNSFEASVDNLRRTTGATLGKRQAEALVVDVAADFEAFYRDRPREKAHHGDLLVLTFDGCGIVMRPEALRAATRKKASRARRRSLAETAAGGTQRSERKHRKRMAEVAAVYALKPVPRTANDVLTELGRSGPHVARPRAKNKRVWASVDRSISDVVDEAFLEAALRDPGWTRRCVVVVDGNREQLGAVQWMAGNYGVEVTIVIDLIHVLGYLWNAGKALAGKDKSAIEEWVSVRARRILGGKSSHVAAGMRRSATTRKMTAKAREPVDACANYLLKYKRYLRYDEYLRDGLPIASGVIEGACRSLVRDRMDITGARWGLAGAEAVLMLRSLRATGDLDEYLDFHAALELDRNHLRRFHEDELGDLREAA